MVRFAPIHTLTKPFSKLRVATQLVLAFGIVLSVTVALGIFSMTRLTVVSAASADIYAVWMGAVNAATNVRSALIDYRHFESKHSRAEDEGYMAEYEDKMKSSSDVIRTNLAAYQKLGVAEADRKLFEKVQKQYSAYDGFSKRVVEHGRAKRTSEARDLEDGASKMAFDDTIAAIDAALASAFKGASAAAAAAEAERKQSQVLISIALAISATVCVLLSLLIVRQIKGQLGGEPSSAKAIAIQIASKDLSKPIVVKPGAEESLIGQMANMRNSISDIVANVRANAESVAQASEEIASGNNDLSSRTEQQAGSLQRTAASIDALKQQVMRNVESAATADKLAKEASSVAAEGGEAVTSVVNTMRGISEASRKINEIVGLIDGIAFQTNILALNAAVEAARAGEQGRGFAVVASEVRSLAVRSGDAAKEIKTLIGDSVARVDEGTTYVDRAGATMTNVVKSIQRVSDLISEISAAGGDQSNSVEEVVSAMNEIDQATQQNAALVEQMAAAASSLRDQAGTLVGVVAEFQLPTSSAGFGGQLSPRPLHDSDNAVPNAIGSVQSLVGATA
jgi:methyl-accepting chemotaxis protein